MASERQERVSIDDKSSASIVESSRALGWYSYSERVYAPTMRAFMPPSPQALLSDEYVSELFAQVVPDILAGDLSPAMNPEMSPDEYELRVSLSREVREFVFPPVADSAYFDSESARWFMDHTRAFEQSHDSSLATELITANYAVTSSLPLSPEERSLRSRITIDEAIRELGELIKR